MKATKFKIITGLFLISFLYSCKKDYSPSYPGYSTLFPDTIISADSPEDPQYFYIDVDKDKINDYEIMCVENHMPAIYTYFENEISCLHKDAFLVIDSISDTTFVNTKINTSYYNNKKEITIEKKFSPKRLDVKDSIAGIKQLYYIVPFEEQGKLKYNNYSNGSFTLTKEDYSIFYWNYEHGPGWESHVDHYYIYPKLFPINKISYVGIRKIVNGKIKNGWIKLFLSYYKSIHILEVAIQK